MGWLDGWFACFGRTANRKPTRFVRVQHAFRPISCLCGLSGLFLTLKKFSLVHQAFLTFTIPFCIKRVKIHVAAIKETVTGNVFTKLS
jgi:hypothetical protein